MKKMVTYYKLNSEQRVPQFNGKNAMNCDLQFNTILMKAKKGFQFSDSTPLEFNIKARSGGVVEAVEAVITGEVAN